MVNPEGDVERDDRLRMVEKVLSLYKGFTISSVMLSIRNFLLLEAHGSTGSARKKGKTDE